MLAAILTVGAQAATAEGFEPGDVLASVGNPSVIARLAPDGTPKGTLADSARGIALLRPVERASRRARDRAP